MSSATARVAPEKACLRPALLSLPVAGVLPEKIMADKELVEKNVMEFLGGATKEYERISGEQFSQEMFNNCIDIGLESPIEKILWIAMHVVCKLNYVELNADPITIDGKDAPGYGMHFSPQFKVDKYRADFSAYYQQHRKETPTWIIECDGHDFHERTKQERQYEKQRDRFFTVRGYKILRFTGSEIVRDAYAVAKEIVHAVTNDDTILTPKEYYGS